MYNTIKIRKESHGKIGDIIKYKNARQKGSQKATGKKGSKG